MVYHFKIDSSTTELCLTQTDINSPEAIIGSRAKLWATTTFVIAVGLCLSVCVEHSSMVVDRSRSNYSIDPILIKKWTCLITLLNAFGNREERKTSNYSLVKFKLHEICALSLQGVRWKETRRYQHKWGILRETTSKSHRGYHAKNSRWELVLLINTDPRKGILIVTGIRYQELSKYSLGSGRIIKTR